MGVYDYDGTLMESLKFDAIRVPGHYIDLEVQVETKEQKNPSLTKPLKKKPAKNVRF